MSRHKRVFGKVEVAFDLVYLVAALIIGVYLLLTGNSQIQFLSGVMALVLALGDCFHLIPRMMTLLTGEEERLAKAMGIGKLITSLTMTVYYIILWHIGLMLFPTSPLATLTWAVYALAAARVVLCLLPQNRWTDRFVPVRYGIYRNVPFFAIGILVAVLFALPMGSVAAVAFMSVAVVLSFLFYLPVVLWANSNPKLGMLMLPKTLCYLWMLVMTLGL